jgi:MFS family permease
MFGEVTLARVGLLLTAASLALLPTSHTLALLLIVSAGLSFGSGLASAPLSGLASQMIDRSWQGRALGIMQSAGSAGRLIGPLLGGWLLMLDLKKPLSEYGRTPFLVAGFICFVGGLLAFCLRRPTTDRSLEAVPIGSNV